MGIFIPSGGRPPGWSEREWEGCMKVVCESESVKPHYRLYKDEIRNDAPSNDHSCLELTCRGHKRSHPYDISIYTLTVMDGLHKAVM